MTTGTPPAWASTDPKAARANRIGPAIDNAWRSPFFGKRLAAAGIEQGAVPSPAQWQRLELTTKEELRLLPADEFKVQLVVAETAEIAMVWRSGAATGRPLFYPKARRDFPDLIESFARVLDMAGLGPGDLVHNSFPYLGVHPIGHMFGHAMRDRGCGNIFAGSGSNTASDVQIELLFSMQPTAWMGIGSYLNQLGHRADAAGHSTAGTSLRRIISSAEPLTPAKRSKMEGTWGAELFDCYGMTECSMMGAECDRHAGLHIWTDMFLVEILDTDTGQPLPAGEVGAVVVTPFHSSSGIPFLRWASGDLGALEPDCDCAYRAFPRLKLAARTLGFSKVRGININHNDLEDRLFRLPPVADFMVTVLTADLADRLQIEIEPARGQDPEDAADTVRRDIAAAFELQPEVVVLARGTVAARLETEVKQVRFRDRRGS